MARRRRYTVYVGGEDTPKVILAYDAMGAREFYEERGRYVHTVEPGDWRTNQARKLEALRADGRWEFDRERIADAFEAVTGLPLPSGVRFEKGKRALRQEGAFDCKIIHGFVEVTVVRIRRTLDIAAANEALWHELAHVAQYARIGDLATYIRRANAEHKARLGYENRPSEREAREWQCLAETDMLLKETP